MAQGGRPKPPLDVLQSMINAILIETGKALRPSNKEGGRTTETVNTRLQTIIPSAVENFHMALDDLECDIIRAKSVLLRDLNGLRAQRIALESPVPILEEVVEQTTVQTTSSNGNAIPGNDLYTSPPTTAKEEWRPRSPEKQTPNEPKPPTPESLPANGTTVLPPEDVKAPPQGPTPSTLPNDATLGSKPIGVDIHDEGAPAPERHLQNSAADTLEVAGNHNSNSALNFVDMEFCLDSTNQTQDPPQTHNNNFDFSSFKNPNPNQTNTNTDDQKKLGEGAFTMVQGMGGGDGDLDSDMRIDGTDDSAFDGMFFGGGENGGASEGGGIQHGKFDNAFFGLA